MQRYLTFKALKIGKSITFPSNKEIQVKKEKGEESVDNEREN